MSLIDKLAKESLGAGYYLKGEPGLNPPEYGPDTDPIEDPVGLWVRDRREDYEKDIKTFDGLLDTWMKKAGFKLDSKESLNIGRGDIDFSPGKEEIDIDLAFEWVYEIKAGKPLSLRGQKTTTSGEVSLRVTLEYRETYSGQEDYDVTITVAAAGSQAEHYKVVFENAYVFTLESAKRGTSKFLKDLEGALGAYVNNKRASEPVVEMPNMRFTEVLHEIEQIGKDLYASGKRERSQAAAFGKVLLDLADSLKKGGGINNMPLLVNDIGMNLRRLAETFDEKHGEGETGFLVDEVASTTKNYRAQAKDVLAILEKIEKQLDDAAKITKKF